LRSEARCCKTLTPEANHATQSARGRACQPCAIRLAMVESRFVHAATCAPCLVSARGIIRCSERTVQDPADEFVSTAAQVEFPCKRNPRQHLRVRSLQSRCDRRSLTLVSRAGRNRPQFGTQALSVSTPTTTLGAVPRCAGLRPPTNQHLLTLTSQENVKADPRMLERSAYANQEPINIRIWLSNYPSTLLTVFLAGGYRPETFRSEVARHVG
jgi:hypothetical protein